MTALAHKMEETEHGARERRDIVSGEVLPEHRLLRFVAGPDGVTRGLFDALLEGCEIGRPSDEAVEVLASRAVNIAGSQPNTR